MIKQYFDNAGINRLYAHNALFTVAETIGWVFGPLYLLELGYTLPIVFLIWAGLFAVRLPLRYLYWWQIERIGLRGGAIIGLGCYAVGALMLPFLPQHQTVLPLFLFFYATGMTLYWTAFHTLFGMIGDAEKRGNQLAMLKSLDMAITAAIPALSGMIVLWFGFAALFWIVAIGMLIAAIPLLAIQPPLIRRHVVHTAEHQKSCRWVAQYHIWHGVKEYGHPFLWRIMVFVFVGNVTDFGWLMTAGLALLIATELFIGKAIDKGDGFRWLQRGAVIAQIQIIFRAFFATTPALIVASETLSVSAQLMAQSTANFYNQGGDADNYFHYIYWGEAGWDIGAALSLSAMAAAIYLGASLPWLLLLTGSFGLWGLYRINMRVRPDVAGH